jgi:hypothetical protein
MDQPETATQENELQKEADAHRRCKVFATGGASRPTTRAFRAARSHQSA